MTNEYDEYTTILVNPKKVGVYKSEYKEGHEDESRILTAIRDNGFTPWLRERCGQINHVYYTGDPVGAKDRLHALTKDLSVLEWFGAVGVVKSIIGDSKYCDIVDIY